MVIITDNIIHHQIKKTARIRIRILNIMSFTNISKKKRKNGSSMTKS